MQKIDNLLDNLSKTKFRGSFHLNNKMKEYVLDKGIDKIEKDAYELITKRLKPSVILNDGKQTPMKQVHPVFIACHATGTCCRKCLEKIHHIKNNKELTEDEVKYVVEVIMNYIKREMK